MNAYLAQTAVNLKLTYRDKVVVFFNYAFPLIFYFVFAGLYKAERGGAIVQVLTMVITIGILGTGFFGAGIRAVQERELGILRRFKVAPIGAGPILISSIVTGVLNYLPVPLVMILLSHFLYGMPFPGRWLSLFAMISLGVVAFRSIGLIIASVVNSAQESQILVQLLYFPMLMLSGATIPLSILPGWLQVVAQFIPSTYLITGMQAILGRNETFGQNLGGAAGLLVTACLATFLSVKLFRWEKDEKLPAASKLWILGALAPFVILGSYQVQTHENASKARMLMRDQRRGRNLLIRNVRIFEGDGTLIESGGVFVKAGKIDKIYGAETPDPQSLGADVIEGYGKTLIPGLIDVYVRLGASGGNPQPASADIPRKLAAYLYSGVTAVRGVGDPLGEAKKWRDAVNSGERLGAELFVAGSISAAPSPDVARRTVAQLKRDGVDGVQAIFGSGRTAVLEAIAAEARTQRLPLAIQTGDSTGVAEAIAAGPASLDRGSTHDRIDPARFVRMKAAGIAYNPALSAIDALRAYFTGQTGPLLDRSLVQQAVPAGLLAATRDYLRTHQPSQDPTSDWAFARQNLVEAAKAGVILIAGSEAGNLLVWHGPTVHREMQLWVEAGLTPEQALTAATYNAAKLLGADSRIGLIRERHDATMLLVSGNPLTDIKATENIQIVFFKGERVDRTDLLEQN